MIHNDILDRVYFWLTTNTLCRHIVSDNMVVPIAEGGRINEENVVRFGNMSTRKYMRCIQCPPWDISVTCNQTFAISVSQAILVVV